MLLNLMDTVIDGSPPPPFIDGDYQEVRHTEFKVELRVDFSKCECFKNKIKIIM